MEKVLMIGTGDVGAHILEIAARTSPPYELVVADINGDRAEQLVNNAKFGAYHHGRYPKFRSTQIDLFDVDGTTELLLREKPDAVINCTVMHTWHLIRQLPEDVYAKISSAALGAWLPCQLALGLKLSDAIHKAGIKPYFINTSLSCLTNPVLAKAGYEPHIGIGNVDMIVPCVTYYIAGQLNIAPQNIELYMVCHHQHWVYPREAGYKPNAPFYIKAIADGIDISDQFDHNKAMYDGVKMYPPGLEFTQLSASSTLKNLHALMFDQNLRTHSPGPRGLPGGYPVRLNAKGAEVVLPPELTLEKAVEMNMRSSYLDGIEFFEDDGTVVFADYTYEIMKETLGFDCKSFTPDECADRAHEMISRYRELANKYGIDY